MTTSDYHNKIFGLIVKLDIAKKPETNKQKLFPVIVAVVIIIIILVRVVLHNSHIYIYSNRY